jgi:hypothetical protein
VAGRSAGGGAGIRLAGRELSWRRLAPTVVAAVPAILYVILSPPSGDLPAHLLRAKLFSAEGFGLWNNWWYGGHHVPLYSVLFPPVAAALTPQVAAALASIATAALFEQLAFRHFGRAALPGSLWFGVGTAATLYAGRLAFGFGLLPAVATALALQRRRGALATGAAFITALCSPVAAAFAALAGAAQAIASYRRGAGWRRTLPGTGVVLAAVLPVVALNIAFPEGGSEPFATSAFLPLPLIGIATLIALPARERTLRIGTALYTLACVLAFAIPNALGSNVVRLGEMVAGPLAAIVWWQRRRALFVVAALPLLYLQFQAPVRDLAGAVGNPSVTAGYYQPVLSFMSRQGGGPFRVEIPFTRFHWEAYQVGQRVPLARGWERQLDIKYNHLFYGGPLTPRTYRAWLDQLAVRFVAVPDAELDYSARAETRLINRGLPYLRLTLRTAHWRIYEVQRATPLAQGVASAQAAGPNWIELTAARPGQVLVHVRFTPYWAITRGAGCVGRTNQGMVELRLRRPGPVRLAISFSPGRIRADSARCT